MKLIAALNLDRPGDHKEVMLRFEGGLTKRVSGKHCENLPQRQYMVYLKLMEAERDFAYQKHGDEWPKYAAKKGEPFKFTCTTDEEKQIIDSAVRMLGGE